MNTSINPVKFKTDEKLDKYINEKVAKLDRMIDNAIKCEVTLKLEKPETDNNQIVDMRLYVPGKDLFVTKQADTFEDAVSQCVDTLKVQIEKYKNA